MIQMIYKYFNFFFGYSYCKGSYLYKLLYFGDFSMINRQIKTINFSSTTKQNGRYYQDSINIYKYKISNITSSNKQIHQVPTEIQYELITKNNRML